MVFRSKYDLSSSIAIGTRKGLFGKPGKKIFASEFDRTRHMITTGTPGSGKSSFVNNLITQDISNGAGCALIDPHADLVNDLLSRLLASPELIEKHKDRIIYFDPTRTDYVIPFNMLDYEFTPHKTAADLVTAFRCAWPKELEAAPIFAEVARNSMLTLMYNNLSLVELDMVLVNKEYRDLLLQKVPDKSVHKFFRGRYEEWGREAAHKRESTLNKVSALTSSPDLRAAISARTNGLKLRQIFDEGKILLIDLGKLDDETAILFSSFFATACKHAIKSRADIPGYKRLPFYLYIDEFHLLLNNDGGVKNAKSIVYEGRKYGVPTHFIHQDLTQLPLDMRGAINNIKYRNAFNLDIDTAKVFCDEFFRYDPNKLKRKTRNRKTGEEKLEYFSREEQKELGINTLVGLESRWFLSKKPDNSVEMLRTLDVPENNVTEEGLEFAKSYLSQVVGESREELESLYDMRQDLGLQMLDQQKGGSSQTKSRNSKSGRKKPRKQKDKDGWFE